MLYVSVDIQVLILIAWGRYVFMMKKTRHHHYCAKVVYEPKCPMELIDTQRSFRY